jgi:hypothetical protein
VSWILEGKQVAGKYFGQSFEGIVVESRVRYGGKVCHTIDELKWRTKPVSRIIVNLGDDEDVEWRIGSK